MTGSLSHRRCHMALARTGRLRAIALFAASPLSILKQTLPACPYLGRYWPCFRATRLADQTAPHHISHHSISHHRAAADRSIRDSLEHPSRSQ